MIQIIKAIETTQVASIAASNSYPVQQCDRFRETATNGVEIPRTVSVDSTAQFIRAQYDSLFKKLAD